LGQARVQASIGLGIISLGVIGKAWPAAILSIVSILAILADRRRNGLLFSHNLD